ncbi:MAG: cell division protein FtsL [Lachnospiraceae bacterium]|nr:cell division protein FtsL [Lachnospiraceae bacterium]
MPSKGAAQRRVNLRSEQDARYLTEGTAAYAPDLYLPETTEKAGEKTKTSRGKRAGVVSPGYVLFLALVCAATVMMCVRYVRLKASITTVISENEELENKLVRIRGENDALLENVNNAIDLRHIKDVAINEMGMKYATEDQIVWYNTDESGFIRQYADVPAS